MKLVLKIIAWPLVTALSILISVCAFLLSRTASFLGLASAALSVLALPVLLAGSAKNAGILLVIAFLISPFGLPKLVALLLGGLMFVNESIRSRVYG